MCGRFLLFVFGAIIAPAQVHVLTANYDNARTNSNLSETILTPDTVNREGFGKLGAFPVDGQIYAQPLYVSGIEMPRHGIRNVVYIATQHNSVYAIDADDPQSTTPLWHVNLGLSVPSSMLDAEDDPFGDISPEVGILSTPVIDLARQAIYVVTDTQEGSGLAFRMHALSLLDGHEMFSGPALIAASSTTAGGETLQFDASQQLQRPGLTLTNGIVYAAFGSHDDVGEYHGWLIGYDASNLQSRIASYSTTPDGWGGSIWQAGRAPAIDENGDLYAVTANGDFDGETNFSQSFLKLAGSSLALLDWYTPDDWEQSGDDDNDLGSGGAILIPGTSLVLGASKTGDLFLVNRDSMGHLGGNSVQRVNVSDRSIFGLAVWNHEDGPIVYVPQALGSLRAFRISSGVVDSAPFSESALDIYPMFGGIAVSANGGTDGTGIVWHITNDYYTDAASGTLRAFDPMDLAHEFWNSDMLPDRDSLGYLAKFATPTIANGRVYVPTFSNQLAMYGLLPAASGSSKAPKPR